MIINFHRIISKPFANSCLNQTKEWIKLKELHKNFPLRAKKFYNVVDYVNSTDYIVRLMEIGLGLQYGGIKREDKKDLWEIVNQGRKSQDNNLNKSVYEENKNPIKFENIDNMSDDVFANNPSNLMLAKVKVKKNSLNNESIKLNNSCLWEWK